MGQSACVTHDRPAAIYLVGSPRDVHPMMALTSSTRMPVSLHFQAGLVIMKTRAYTMWCWPPFFIDIVVHSPFLRTGGFQGKRWGWPSHLSPLLL
jgi:hypothetical protein